MAQRDVIASQRKTQTWGNGELDFYWLTKWGVGGMHMLSLHWETASIKQAHLYHNPLLSCVPRVTSTCPGHETFESEGQTRFLMLLCVRATWPTHSVMSHLPRVSQIRTYQGRKQLSTWIKWNSGSPALAWSWCIIHILHKIRRYLSILAVGTFQPSLPIGLKVCLKRHSGSSWLSGEHSSLLSCPPKRGVGCI